jgi:hypothetical protein
MIPTSEKQNESGRPERQWWQPRESRLKLLVGKAKISEMVRKRRFLVEYLKLLAMKNLESSITRNQPIEKLEMGK